jgi:hypothetical protein
MILVLVDCLYGSQQWVVSVREIDVGTKNTSLVEMLLHAYWG